MRHPNEDLLRRYFEAAERGDMATLDDVFADDVIAHIAGDHELRGAHRGKAAVFDFFGQLAERSGGTARLVMEEAVADDWFAVALVSVQGRIGDSKLDGEPAAVVFRIEDGRFVELWSHHHDQAKLDRFWSSPQPVPEL
jgi:uncharacterized protein